MNIFRITKLFLAFSLLLSFFTQFHPDFERDSNSDSELSYAVDNSYKALSHDEHRPISTSENPINAACHTCHLGHVGCVFQLPILFTFISKGAQEDLMHPRSSSKYINPYLKLIKRPPIYIA